MRHASLFSGIGGFELAAEWMGWTNVFAVEKDPDCQKVLKKNFPDINIHDDIKEFVGEKYKGSIDIISGGFPCQPFSIAGKQKSKEDDRYLWPEMLRVIREIKPTWVVGENVPGIISLALDQVLSDLEGEGYTCQSFVIPACAVNAVHRRDRVWILAYSENNRYGRRSSQERANLRERELLSREQKRGKMGGQVERRTRIKTSSNSDNDGSSDGFENRQRTQRSSTKGGVFQFEEENPRIAIDSDSNKHRADWKENEIETGIPRVNRSEKLLSWKSSRANGDASNSDNIGIRRYQREGIEKKATSRSNTPPNQRWKRLSYPVSQPTICRGDDGVSYRLDDDRLITSKQRNNSLKQLGNSVVPQLVYEIFKIIEKSLAK